MTGQSIAQFLSLRLAGELCLGSVLIGAVTIYVAAIWIMATDKFPLDPPRRKWGPRP